MANRGHYKGTLKQKARRGDIDDAILLHVFSLEFMGITTVSGCDSLSKGIETSSRHWYMTLEVTKKQLEAIKRVAKRVDVLKIERFTPVPKTRGRVLRGYVRGPGIHRLDKFVKELYQELEE